MQKDIFKMIKKIKSLMKTDSFASYCIWATIQHTMVLALAWPWSISLGSTALLATAIFGLRSESVV